MSQGSTSINQLPEDLTGSGNLKAALVESTVTISTNIDNVPDVTISAGVDVNNFPAVQAVSQDGVWNINNVSGTISLPTGASIAAKQPALGTAGTASADVITVQGIASMTPLKVDASGFTVPVSQSGFWDIRHITGTVSLPTGAATEATLATLLTSATFTARVNVLGQNTMAASTPIVIASDQSAVPASQSGIWDIRHVTGTVSLPTGASTEATLATRLSESAFQARINTLGQKTMANSTPIVIASDQSVIDTNVKNVLFDSFGRLKIQQNSTLFESKEDIQQQTHLWHTLTATGGTIVYTSSTASNALAVTTSSGSRAVRQSRMHASYRPGKGVTLYATGVFGSGQSNTVKRIGLFDDNNGIFFELNGTTQRVVVRKNTSDTNAISSGSWNGHATGIAADWTKAQIFYIQFQWLGVGRIEMGVVIDGVHYPIHYFNNANSVTEVYMQTPNLPVRYEIVNTAGAAGASSLIQICSSIFLEGQFEKIGTNYSCNNSTTTRSIGTANVLPVLMIRPKSGVPHPAFVISTLDIVATTFDNLYWELNLNPTLTGGAAASWNSVHANSYMEFDVAATGAMSGGQLIRSGYLNSQTRQSGFPELGENLNLLSTDLSSNRDILALGMRNFTGTSLVISALNWREYT